MYISLYKTSECWGVWIRYRDPCSKSLQTGRKDRSAIIRIKGLWPVYSGEPGEHLALRLEQTLRIKESGPEQMLFKQKFLILGNSLIF